MWESLSGPEGAEGSRLELYTGACKLRLGPGVEVKRSFQLYGGEVKQVEKGPWMLA